MAAKQIFMDGTWGKCADLNLVHKKGWANVLLFVIKPNFTFFQVQIEGLFRNTFEFAKNLSLNSSKFSINNHACRQLKQCFICGMCFFKTHQKFSEAIEP